MKMLQAFRVSKEGQKSTEMVGLDHTKGPVSWSHPVFVDAQRPDKLNV